MRLIERGAKPGARDDKSYTPLHYALRYGHADRIRLETLEALFEAGMNPRDLARNGRPLVSAVRNSKYGEAEHKALLIEVIQRRLDG